jgi:hypothetical protein
MEHVPHTRGDEPELVAERGLQDKTGDWIGNDYEQYNRGKKDTLYYLGNKVGEGFRRPQESPPQTVKNITSTEEKVKEEISPAFNPDKAFRRTPDEMLTDGEPIGRSDITKFLTEKLDIPIRTGKFRDRALGIFKPREEVIRSKFANDIEVIAHEVGHALQKYLWPESFKKNLISAPFSAFKCSPHTWG